MNFVNCLFSISILMFAQISNASDSSQNLGSSCDEIHRSSSSYPPTCKWQETKEEMEKRMKKRQQHVEFNKYLNQQNEAQSENLNNRIQNWMRDIEIAINTPTKQTSTNKKPTKSTNKNKGPIILS